MSGPFRVIRVELFFGRALSGVRYFPLFRNIISRPLKGRMIRFHILLRATKGSFSSGVDICRMKLLQGNRLALTT